MQESIYNPTTRQNTPYRTNIQMTTYRVNVYPFIGMILNWLNLWLLVALCGLAHFDAVLPDGSWDVFHATIRLQALTPIFPFMWLQIAYNRGELAPALHWLVTVILVTFKSKLTPQLMSWGFTPMRPACEKLAIDLVVKLSQCFKGLPSGHAIYTAAFTLGCYFYIGKDNKYLFFLLAWNALVAWATISGEFHTWQQYAIGYALGLLVNVSLNTLCRFIKWLDSRF